MSVLPTLRPRRVPIRGAAWALSVVAHAALLSWLISSPERHEWPASVGQRVGALQVRLNERPHDGQQANVAQPTPPDSVPINTAALSNTRVLNRSPHKPLPRPQPGPAQPAAADTASAASSPTPALPASAATPPPPATSAPGASFANLFAPFISRPMGRGRWGSPPPPAPPPPSPEVLRQQAVQARREQLMQSIQWLQTQLDQTPLVATCQVQITLSQSAGSVACQDPVDQNRLSATLSPFLSAAQTGVIPSEACLSLHERRIDWTPCPATATADRASSPP